MRLATFLITFSALLTGCGVPRPDTNLCVLNTESLYKYCYNMKNDYDGDGRLKKDAKPLKKLYPTEHDMMIDLHKNVSTDPTGFGNLKLYVGELISRQ